MKLWLHNEHYDVILETGDSAPNIPSIQGWVAVKVRTAKKSGSAKFSASEQFYMMPETEDCDMVPVHECFCLKEPENGKRVRHFGYFFALNDLVLAMQSFKLLD